MKTNVKILIAGVGGQGIVYLTNLIAEAAVISGIPVCVSEIHGLSQRGGTVTAGIGLGEFNTGFTGKANVDFLIGLEPLETQRCTNFIHRQSVVIFGNNKILPHSVNAGQVQYPDTNSFTDYLNGQCKKVVYVDEFPAGINTIHHNVFFVGIASGINEFPLSVQSIEEAISRTVPEIQIRQTLNAFRMGYEYLINPQTV